MSPFGEYLRQLRKEKKVTQRRLAKLVGIDFTYISKIENGSMNPPAEDKIIRIAEVLDVEPDKLILAAKRVPSSYKKMIVENEHIPIFLRRASQLSPDQWAKIQKIVDEEEGDS